jgi:hypothetical protein
MQMAQTFGPGWIWQALLALAAWTFFIALVIWTGDASAARLVLLGLRYGLGAVHSRASIGFLQGP